MGGKALSIHLVSVPVLLSFTGSAEPAPAGWLDHVKARAAILLVPGQVVTTGRRVRGGLRSRRLIASTLAAVVTLFGASVARAATFLASSTVDAVDANPGDGLCRTARAECTLRAAIMEVNALGGQHGIDLLGGATYTLSIKGPGEDRARTGDLDITSAVFIRPTGAPAIIRGGNSWNDRIFDIFPAESNSQLPDVSLFRVHVQNGNSETPGGGIRIQPDFGCISCTSEIVESTISGSGAPIGGGIFNSGRLTIRVSTVFGNHAANGGGIANDAGGTGGKLSIVGSTISGNTAEVKSGGNSTFPDGGGIWNTGELILDNSTISGNKAAGSGGGLFNIRAVTANQVTANNVTIAANVADSDGNGAGDGGGVANLGGGTFTFGNTILGANLDQAAPDCVGALNTIGFNLIQNITGCTISGNATGHITGRSPLLGPLQNNGGPTFTHALQQGSVARFSSPAIDAGNTATTGNTRCFSTDQRGVSRPRDGNGDGIARCDIGAYETSTPSFTLGVFSLEPSEATVAVGQRVSYNFEWTVPGPGWRALDSLQLRIFDEQGTILWVSFQEVAGEPGTFNLINPKDGTPGPAFAPGMPHQLETEAATMYLAGSAVDGPPGSSVGLTLDLSFKPLAAGREGRSYQIEVLAIDDAGQEQGFTVGGLLTVQ